MKLKEGGNVFKDVDNRAATQRINQTDVKPTLAWLEQMLGIDLQGNMLGSTGLKPTSGDMDVAVNTDEITPEQLIKELTNWCIANKLKPQEYVKRGGGQVHFRTPITGNPDKGYVQTDFMFMKDMNLGKFFLTAPTNSEYSGRDRHILLNSIGKPLGVKIDARRGLVNRDTDEVVSTDPDKIAQFLLNPGATKDDLYSVESMLQALQGDAKRDAKLADARAFFKQENIPFFEDRGESDINFLARLRDRIVNQGMSVIVESSNARIEHLEDLVFEKGSRGIADALAIVQHAKENTAGTTTVKWDGKPAIIWGRKPDGTFVLTDKAGFHAKGYDGLATSPVEIARIMTNRGGERGELIGIYERLFPLLQAATPDNFKGYVKGDLLYMSQPPEIAGAYVFKPNTVEYKIPATSNLGQNIGQSEVGIAVHTRIKEHGGAEEPLSRTTFNPVPGLLLIEPSVKDIKNVAPENKLVTQLKQLLRAKGPAIDSLFNPAELRAAGITDLPQLCKRYINSRIDTDYSNLLPGFGQWLQTHVTPRKFNNIVEYLQSPRANMDGITAAFTAFLGLHDLKTDMLSQLDRQQPGQEGWVVATPAGRAKLVNRFGFSAANRAQNNPIQ